MEHDLLCGARDAEGIDCWTGYEAMNNYTLLQPQKSKLAVPSAFPEYFDFKNMKLPAAERACEHEAVWLDENVFRASQKKCGQRSGSYQKDSKERKGIERRKYGRQNGSRVSSLPVF